MSISTRSPYQQAPYPQACLSFSAFMEDTDLDAILGAMPVKQTYIKMDEVEKLADALLDNDMNKEFMKMVNDAYGRGTNPPVIHEQVYSKPISGNLIDFNDPALKKLTRMLPIKGIEKKIVGDIERKSLKGDLGTTIKSASLGDADGYISNIEPQEYNFVAEDGMISSLYIGKHPVATHIMSSHEFDTMRVSLITRIYKLLRIAYDGLLIGTTDKANKIWSEISRFDYAQYKKTVTAQRAVADALRAQIQLIVKKNKTNLEEALKISLNIVKRAFPYNGEYSVVSSFIAKALKGFTDQEFVDKLSKMFLEDFNRPTPSIVYQNVDIQDIEKLVYMFKKYINLLKS